MFKMRSTTHYLPAFILMLLLAGITTSLQAQEISPKPEKSSQPTESMRRFLATNHAPQSLPPATLTLCIGGVADTGTVQYPCNNVDLAAFLPLSGIGGGSGNDIWGWTGCGGREFALMGRTNGTAFVEVTDPVNPIYLGNLPGHNNSSSTWRDIKTYADHAFIGSEAGGHGMQIFDLSQLCTVASPPATFSETAHYSSFGSTHNIVINEDSGYAYGVGGDCSGGLHAVDISTPTSPVSAGCFSADGYTHDAQCVNYAGTDPDHQGKEICFNSNEDTLTIVDVTNKAAPVQLARLGYTGSAYSHQGWLTEDHSYFLLGDELDESNFGHNTRTYIFDVRDLDTPSLINTYDSSVSSIDHNMYILDGYVFQSNYTGGLRILDSSDVANGNLTEVAFFDTYPSSNSASFNGTWSNYPYFASGTIVVSGIGEGLFILQPSLAADYSMNVNSQSLNICSNGSDSTTINLVDRFGYTGNVTLSALGLPASLTPSLSTNPVSVPGSSDLTITSSGATAGNYPFTLLGDDGTITHTVDMSVNIYDTTPSAPTLTAPANGAINQPVRPNFSWSAVAQADSYNLEVATDANFSNIIYSASVAGTSHIPSSNLSTNSHYYWRVQAVNSCATGSYSSTYEFSTMAAPGDCGVGTVANNIYSEDFDAGNGSWSTGGTGSTWTWSSSNGNGNGGWHAQNVASVSDQYLYTPLFPLPNESDLTLQFWNRQEMEDRSGGCYDGGILEVSTDAGTTWTQITSGLLTDPYDGPVSTSYNNPIGGKNAWCGDPQAWLNSVIEIDAYAGQTAQFRFRLGTDSSVSRPGWNIDTVKVQSCVPSAQAGVTLSADNTLTGLPETTVVHSVVVENSGTISDSYDLAIAGNSWATILSDNSVTLNASSSTVVAVTVTLPTHPAGTDVMTDTFTLTATSQADNSVSDTYNGTTRSEITPSFNFTGTNNQVGVAGQTITYTLTIQNNGNYTDTFSLQLGAYNWTTTLSANSISLAAGQSGIVEVYVMIGAGMSDSVDVTATSNWDNTLQQTITLNSSTNRLYLPIIFRE